MRISLEVDIEALKKEIPSIQKAVKEGTALSMFRAMTILKAQVMQNIRVNSGLHVRTGNLLNSINTRIRSDKDRMIGTVTSEGVPYAITHEYGTIVPGHYIYPMKSQSLRWESGGSVFFAKRVFVPTYKIPARPFMWPAIEAKSQEIFETFGLLIDKQLGD